MIFERLTRGRGKNDMYLIKTLMAEQPKQSSRFPNLSFVFEYRNERTWNNPYSPTVHTSRNGRFCLIILSQGFNDWGQSIDHPQLPNTANRLLIEAWFILTNSWKSDRHLSRRSAHRSRSNPSRKLGFTMLNLPFVLTSKAKSKVVEHGWTYLSLAPTRIPSKTWMPRHQLMMYGR